MNSFKANSRQKMRRSKFLKKSNKFKKYPAECSRCKKPISSDRQDSVSSLPFEFCRVSSLHGLQFIGNPRIHNFERYKCKTTIISMVGILTTIAALVKSNEMVLQGLLAYSISNISKSCCIFYNFDMEQIQANSYNHCISN